MEQRELVPSWRPSARSQSSPPPQLPVKSRVEHHRTEKNMTVPVTKPARDYVRIFDTTLRDGEQCPGATLTSEEKLEVARALSRLGVDVIEAGFPSASPDDFQAVHDIAETVGLQAIEGSPSGEPPIVCGLARATEKDIQTAFDAIKIAKFPRIHVFLATSPLHRE